MWATAARTQRVLARPMAARTAIFRGLASAIEMPHAADSAADASTSNAAKLLCRTCLTPIAQTKDLAMQSAQTNRGKHVTVTTSPQVVALSTRLEDAPKPDTGVKKVVHCSSCDGVVGVILKRSKDVRLLAQNVVIQPPTDSGDTHMLEIAKWSELAAMLDANPDRKRELQIEELSGQAQRMEQREQPKTYTSKASEREAIGKFLQAESIHELVRLVGEYRKGLTLKSIVRAFSCAAVLRKQRGRALEWTSVPFVPRSKPGNEKKSLDLLPVSATTTLSVSANEDQQIMKLVDILELVLQEYPEGMTNRSLLTSLTLTLSSLRIGRASLISRLAANTLEVLDYQQDAHILCLATICLAMLSSGKEPEVLKLLDEFADGLVANKKSICEGQQQRFPVTLSDVLGLARAFASLGRFHEGISSWMLEWVAQGELENLPTDQFNRQRLLRRNLYELHLDNQLAGRDEKFTLGSDPDRLKQCRKEFSDHEQVLKGENFRFRRAIATALTSMKMHPRTCFELQNGYVVDVALPSRKFGVEIITKPVTLLSEPTTQQENDVKDTRAPLRALLYVDIKQRHLTSMGWTVLRVYSEQLAELQNQDALIAFLSPHVKRASDRATDPLTLKDKTASADADTDASDHEAVIE